MRFLLVLPVLLALACARARSTPIEERIAERLSRLEGTMGVAAKNLTTGEEIAVGADARFPTASLIKLGVLVEVFHRIGEGGLRSDQLVRVEQADRVGDDGIVDALHEGAALTVADLTRLMIRSSDNSATNVLIRLVGTDAVNRRLAAYGLEDTLLFRPTFRDGRADVHPELEVEYGLGMSTPRDLARLMEAIAEGRVVHRGACDAMIAILKGQEDRLMIPRSLPFEGEVVVVANKTGWDEEKRPDASGFKGGVRGDAAIVLGPRARYVVAILARRIRDKSPGADNAALVTGAAISRMIYDHFNGEEAPR